LDTIRLVEELAANAWAPYTVQTLGEWRLRAAFGVTKRANSAWTAGNVPDGPWLAAVEEFYERRGLAPCFYVCDATPAGVDDALEAAGYEVLFPCYMMKGAVEDVLAAAPPDDRFEARLEPEADDRWIADFLRLEGFETARTSAYAHIFRAIGPKKTFLRLADRDGALVALATGVTERGFAGISNVIVAPEHRRRGAGAQTLRAIAAWAKEQGAERLWLQVLAENAPAIALYRKLGFEKLSRNHYRLKRR